MVFLPKDNFHYCFVLFLSRPNTGRSPFEEEKTDLLHKYNRISLEDAGRAKKTGLVRLSFVFTTRKPGEIRSAVRVFYCDLFEI